MVLEPRVGRASDTLVIPFDANWCQQKRHAT